MISKSTKRLLLLVGLAAGATLAVLLPRPREPRYAGKSLNYWLEQLAPKARSGPYSWRVEPNEALVTEKTRQAQVAIHSIGVAAIPFLLDKVQREHGSGGRLYAAVWPYIPVAARQRLSPPRQYRNYGNPHSQVVWALETLDTNAVPALISALRSHNSEVQITVMAALCVSGANADTAIPGLISMAKHPNGFVRRWAMFTLGRMGPQRTNAIPTLIAALHDTEISPLPGSSARVRETATEVLGEIGPQAQAASPELKKLLTDADPGLRQEAAMALWRIVGDRDVMPILVAELKMNQDPRRIIWTLAEMGPDARPAVAAIKDALGPRWFRADTFRADRPATSLPSHWPMGASLEQVVGEALRRIEPDITNELSDTSFLKASPLKLNGGGGSFVLSGNWNTVAALGPEAAPAVLQVLRRDPNPNSRIQAMLTLGEMGWKPTADLVPSLTRFLDDKSAFRYRGWQDQDLGREFVCIADLAAEMLGQIGPDARPALAPLRQMLTDSYWNARPYVPLAIWRIDHDTNVLQYIVANLQSAGTVGTYRRFLAITAEMGSDAKPAVPAILRGMTNLTGDLSRPVRDALLKIDPEAAKVLDLVY